MKFDEKIYDEIVERMAETALKNQGKHVVYYYEFKTFDCPKEIRNLHYRLAAGELISVSVCKPDVATVMFFNNDEVTLKYVFEVAETLFQLWREKHGH